MKTVGKITDIIATVVLLALMIAYVIVRLQLKHEQDMRAEMALIAATYKIELEKATLLATQYQDSVNIERQLNDSMKLELGVKDLLLADLKLKHKKELEELKKIPPDTVYKRLQALYPNVDALPQKYPFSSSQIVPIYSTSIYSQQLQSEYNLLDATYKDCRNLTTGLTREIVLLDSTNINLRRAVVIGDIAINSLVISNSSLKADNKKLKTWTKITAAVGTIFAIIAVAK